MKSLSPYNFNKDIFVENCSQIRIDSLLKTCREQLKKLTLEMEIAEMGLKLELTTSKTNFNGNRYWFECPICKRKSGVIYKHPITNQIGCRLCLGIEYKKKPPSKSQTASVSGVC